MSSISAWPAGVGVGAWGCGGSGGRLRVLLGGWRLQVGGCLVDHFKRLVRRSTRPARPSTPAHR